MHRQPLPTLSTGRNWTRQERIHRKPTARPTRLTPSMAFLRGRVWETESGSWGQGSVLLRLHRPGSNRFPRPPRTHLSPGSPPAPPGRQLLPLLRLERSCPRRGARRPPSAEFAGPAPAGVERDLSDQRSADSGPSRQAALPTVLPQAGPTVTLQGVHIVPEARGSSWGTGRRGSR